MAVKETSQTRGLAPGSVQTLTRLAEACRVTLRTVQNWRRSADFPGEADGGYSIWAVAEWYWRLGPGRGLAKADAANESGQSESANLELLREEKFRIARLERLEREGRLVPVPFVKAFVDIAGTKLREFSEQLPANDSIELQRVLEEIHTAAAEWTRANSGAFLNE